MTTDEVWMLFRWWHPELYSHETKSSGVWPGLLQLVDRVR